MPTKPTVQKGMRKGKVATPSQPSPSRGGRKKGVASREIPPPRRSRLGGGGKIVDQSPYPSTPPPGEGGKPKPVRKSVRIPQPLSPKGGKSVKRKVLTQAPRGILQRSLIGRYLFLPTDLLVLAWRFAKFAWKSRMRVAIVATVATVGHFLFGAGVEGMLFLAFFTTVFAWNLDGRVSIGAGLACLVLIMLLQALIQSGVLLLFDESTETVAVWAYYFLVIGVLKQMVDFVQEGRRMKDEG